MTSSFPESLKKSLPLIGILITSRDPSIAEAISHTGIDWLFIDTEHGILSVADAQEIIRATAGRCFNVVRIPTKHDEVRVKQALDIGCDGIIVPMVDTPEEARNLVRWAKYAPEGERSVGIARAHRYGDGFADYVDAANHTTAVIVQIETATAVKNIDAIMAVEGIDAVFIGAYDLSASMGLMGQVAHSDVQGAIQRVKDAAAKRGMAVGIFVNNVEAAQAQMQSGIRLLALGVDIGLLAQAVEKNLNQLKKA